MKTLKDKRQFFQTAFESLRECQTIFKLDGCNEKELNVKADH